MLLSRSHIDQREADRAMIAAATERFLAAGNAVKEFSSGACADLGEGRDRMARVFTINPQSKEDRPRPRRKAPARRAPSQGNPEALKKAHAVKSEMRRREREVLSAKVAIHAGLGDTITETARALGISRNHLKRIAREHSISFTTTPGRKAQ
ncbi:hypothetical protein [Pseudomonas phage Itty13]|uniref:Uncharacterized protein n=1 Tax=Pseudomonas phage Itty13 TaxID=2805750 RepID=A0A889IR11_9CAUD|nr:hypothetical protein PQC19_gp64 [Pseudomonas phage Itty13]QRE00640.1 hypothetical protein [Pseudomonas phage Itty13]